MGEVLCLGKSCPLNREVVDVDQQDGTQVYESWCFAQPARPSFLFSVNVRDGSQVAFEASIACVYPPIWVNPSKK